RHTRFSRDWSSDVCSSDLGDGHGSHTASTAAGNRHEVTLTYGPDSFTRTVQGVAPRANIVAYRVCVTTCPVSAILAGINQAIAEIGRASCRASVQTKESFK